MKYEIGWEFYAQYLLQKRQKRDDEAKKTEEKSLERGAWAKTNGGLLNGLHMKSIRID